MADGSMKRCKNNMIRVMQKFKGDDVVRSTRVKRVQFKRPVVKLAPVFYDDVSEIENRAGDIGATIEEKHERSGQQK